MSDVARQFDVDRLSVRVFDSETALVEHAAGLAAEALAKAIAARGSASAILATGNSQLKFLDALIARRSVEWPRVTLFHMDEYLGIGSGHAASFCRYMRERVESRVHPKLFHYLAGDALDPIAECERYESLLKLNPPDLCCLGIGENGHLAFNDPPVARFDDARWVKIVALDETNRAQQAGYGHFKNLDEVPRYGLTLTIPALLAAGRVLCLAGGARKVKPVQAALRGPVSEACPASALRTREGAVLLLDRDAAAGL